MPTMISDKLRRHRGVISILEAMPQTSPNDTLESYGKWLVESCFRHLSLQTMLDLEAIGDQRRHRQLSQDAPKVSGYLPKSRRGFYLLRETGQVVTSPLPQSSSDPDGQETIRAWGLVKTEKRKDRKVDQTIPPHSWVAISISYAVEYIASQTGGSYCSYRCTRLNSEKVEVTALSNFTGQSPIELITELHHMLVGYADKLAEQAHWAEVCAISSSHLAERLRARKPLL